MRTAPGQHPRRAVKAAAPRGDRAERFVPGGSRASSWLRLARVGRPPLSGIHRHSSQPCAAGAGVCKGGPGGGAAICARGAAWSPEVNSRPAMGGCGVLFLLLGDRSNFLLRPGEGARFSGAVPLLRGVKGERKLYKLSTASACTLLC